MLILLLQCKEHTSNIMPQIFAPAVLIYDSIEIKNKSNFKHRKWFAFLKMTIFNRSILKDKIFGMV